ncbi:hypothetical protein CHS0354_024267 [Potamilus streckersoni]|uniref:Large ribosomal subunit protein mL49 n=1 Tax=Potamilus streckersoni TaxID=2493646 RepID=A0AAE0VY19_9BIVA|nr:hypothetical protein CHS0354_024267 [Potamilus streckersoni]
MAASMISVVCRCGRNILRSQIKGKKYCDERAWHGSAVLRATDESTHREEEYVDIEFSTDEFKYVEKLLPSKTVPEPPKHTLYPTPSGWVPPAANLSTPYAVNRTKNHNLPVYLQVKVGGTRKLTLIRKIDGDIWALEADIRNFLEPITGKKCLTQVHEVARFIRVRGNYVTEVGKFLIDKGF